MDKDKKCAMDTDSFKKAMNSTILKLWRAKNPIANLKFVPQDAKFEAWRSAALTADPLRLQPTFCCQEASPFGAGLTIVPPSRVRNGLKGDLTFIGGLNETAQADILPAFVPGNSGYIGAAGFSMLRGSLNPSFAWSLIAFTIHPSNRFLSEVGHFTQTLPPYKAVQDRAPFTGNEYDLLKTQFQNSAPFHSPMDSGMEFSGDFIDCKPLRMFLMETAWKFVPLDEAIDRACTVIDTFALPSCSQASFPQQIRQCDSRTGYRKIELQPAQLMNATCKISVDRQVGANLDCTFVPFESAFGTSAAVLNGIVVFLAMATLLMMYRLKDAWVLESNLVSYLAIITGGMFMVLAGLFYLGTPNNGFCVMRVWLLDVGFLMSFGLIVTMLVRQLFGTQVMKITYGVTLGLNGLLLLIWTFLPSPFAPQAAFSDLPVRELERGNAIRIQTPLCHNGNVSMLVAIVVLNGLLLIAGLALGLALAIRSSSSSSTSSMSSSSPSVALGTRRWLPHSMTLLALSSALLGFLVFFPVVWTQPLERNRVFVMSMGSFFVGLFSLVFFAWPTLLTAWHESANVDPNGKSQDGKRESTRPRYDPGRDERKSGEWFGTRPMSSVMSTTSINNQMPASSINNQMEDSISAATAMEDGSDFSEAMVVVSATPEEPGSRVTSDLFMDDHPPMPRSPRNMDMSMSDHKASMFMRPLTMSSEDKKGRQSDMSFMTSMMVDRRVTTARPQSALEPSAMLEEASKSISAVDRPFSMLPSKRSVGTMFLPSVDHLPTPPPPVVLRNTTVFSQKDVTPREDDQQQRPMSTSSSTPQQQPRNKMATLELSPVEVLRMRRSTYLIRYSSAARSDVTRMSTFSTVSRMPVDAQDQEDEPESPDADLLRDAMLQRFKTMSISAELAPKSDKSQRDSSLAPAGLSLTTDGTEAPANDSTRSSLLNDYYGQF